VSIGHDEPAADGPNPQVACDLDHGGQQTLKINASAPTSITAFSWRDSASCIARAVVLHPAMNVMILCLVALRHGCVNAIMGLAARQRRSQASGLLLSSLSAGRLV
jgi:hypothetical protein